MVSIILGQVAIVYLLDCSSAYNAAIYDPDYDYNEGLCDHIIEYYTVFYDQDDIETTQVINGMSIGKALEIILILLPTITFLAFDDPHDCFKCFGKDPDRNYSRY